MSVQLVNNFKQYRPVYSARSINQLRLNGYICYRIVKISIIKEKGRLKIIFYECLDNRSLSYGISQKLMGKSQRLQLVKTN